MKKLTCKILLSISGSLGFSILCISLLSILYSVFSIEKGINFKEFSDIYLYNFNKYFYLSPYLMTGFIIVLIILYLLKKKKIITIRFW